MEWLKFHLVHPARLYSNRLDWLSNVLKVGDIAERLMKLVDLSKKVPTSGSRPVRGHRLTESEIDQLVESFKSGVTVKELAKHFSINRTTVMDHLRRRKVPRQGEWSTSAIKKAAARYKVGETLDEIAATMNVDPRTVGRQLKLAGVVIRPSGPRRRIDVPRASF